MNRTTNSHGNKVSLIARLNNLEQGLLGMDHVDTEGLHDALIDLVEIVREMRQAELVKRGKI